MRHYAVRPVAADPERAIADARRVLRRRFFRVAGSNGGGPPALAAEKGLAREVGSLLFHWSFFLILVGMVWGKGTGFTGQAVIVEGQTWTEAAANYDGRINEGRFTGDGDHSGVRIHVDDFTATYRIPSGIPEDFVTHAALYDANGGYVRTVDIRVNHPAEIDGVKFYQFGYGWAPVVDVRQDGEPIASGPVVCTQGPPPPGVSALQLPWNCVVKLPTLTPQVGIRFELWPDSRGLYALLQTGRAMPMLTQFAPVMTYTAYRGDLRAELVQNATVLDTTGMRRWKQGVIGAGETKDLGSGLSVSFPDLRQYTVLEVKRDRGLWIMLLAALLILVGLLPALYSSRRKLWVTAEPDGRGALGQHVRVLVAARAARGGGLPVRGGGCFQGPPAGRVRPGLLRAHDGHRGDVPLRGAGAARAGIELLLDQDPRRGGDHRFVALRVGMHRDHPVSGQGPPRAPVGGGGGADHGRLGGSG